MLKRFIPCVHPVVQFVTFTVSFTGIVTFVWGIVVVNLPKMIEYISQIPNWEDSFSYRIMPVSWFASSLIVIAVLGNLIYHQIYPKQNREDKQ